MVFLLLVLGCGGDSEETDGGNRDYNGSPVIECGDNNTATFSVDDAMTIDHAETRGQGPWMWTDDWFEYSVLGERRVTVVCEPGEQVRLSGWS